MTTGMTIVTIELNSYKNETVARRQESTCFSGSIEQDRDLWWPPIDMWEKRYRYICIYEMDTCSYVDIDIWKFT